MKRIFVCLLTLSLLLSLAACGAPAEPTVPATDAPAAEVTGEAPTEMPTEAPAEVPTEAPAITLEKLELVNSEEVTFTVTEFQNNEHLGLQMHVYCENKSERPMIFSLDGVSVCGIMYDPFWAEEVAPGKAVNSIVSFDTFDLEQMGVRSVDEINFRLSVIDSEEWMNEPFVDEYFTVYPTGLDADRVMYPEYQHKNGETILLDDQILFIVEKVDDIDGDLYTLNCYIANRTDKDLLISWDNVSVNGMMVDPFWASAVGAGKQLYTQISFYRSDLEAQGIETVSEIEFTLCAYDYSSFDGNAVLEQTITYLPN